MTNKVLTPEAAAITGKTSDAFRKYIARDDTAPKPVKIGCQLFYDRREMVAYAKRIAAKRRSRP